MFSTFCFAKCSNIADSRWGLIAPELFVSTRHVLDRTTIADALKEGPPPEALNGRRSMAIAGRVDTVAQSEADASRWLQLLIGIVCMCMIANLQYGWTFFVGPLHDRHGWEKASIQVAFTIFVLCETWLVPIEGWIVDKYGPRLVVLFGASFAVSLGS